MDQGSSWRWHVTGYRRALLRDMGINCQENAKLARCWNVVEEAGFIYCKQHHVFSPDRKGEGRARLYAVGPRALGKIKADSSPESVPLPDWLQEAVSQWYGAANDSPVVVQASIQHDREPEWRRHWTKQQVLR